MSVIEEVQAERERQDEQWGGPDHDDEHSAEKWCDLVYEYLSRAWQTRHLQPSDGYRKRMVQVAALAVAAIESHDREIERSSEVVSD